MGVERLNESEPDGLLPLGIAFAEYRDAVARNADSADVQRAWVMGQPLIGVDELLLELDDAVLIRQPRLLRAGLLDLQAVEAVAKILAEYDSWVDPTLWRSWAAMNRPEWESVRRTARRALVEVDRVSSAQPHGLRRP